MRSLLNMLMLMGVLATTVLGDQAAKITSVKGDVKIRRGVEENWSAATAGNLLEDMDSIVTGETSEVVLLTREGRIFKLGSQCILDMNDLRKIDEQEMFLLLMSQKIGNIENRKERSRLQLGNVTVIHGENKGESSREQATGTQIKWQQELNGAKELYQQEYFTNAVVKFAKINSRYPGMNDCGEVHFCQGQSFAALHQIGQALEAFRASIETMKKSGCSDQESVRRRQEAEKIGAALKNKAN